MFAKIYISLSPRERFELTVWLETGKKSEKIAVIKAYNALVSDLAYK